MIESDVLSVIVKEYVNECWQEGDIIKYSYRTSSCGMTPHGYMDIEAEIDIYKLMFLCKEYLKNEYWLCVWSGNGWEKMTGYECNIVHFMYGDIKTFTDDTEFGAVVKALTAVLNDEVSFD